jgi:hypothetical protein
LGKLFLIYLNPQGLIKERQKASSKPIIDLEVNPLGKEKKETVKISGSQTKETEGRKEKKNTKIKSIDPAEKTESWFERFFCGLLYYRSERKHLSENCPKVKLPRSRHK